MAETDRGQKFRFKVNGILIATSHERLVARDILELAKRHDAIPGNPEDYTLQGDKGQYKSDDWVDLEEDNVFITIPIAPTPVA